MSKNSKALIIIGALLILGTVLFLMSDSGLGGGGRGPGEYGYDSGGGMGPLGEGDFRDGAYRTDPIVPGETSEIIAAVKSGKIDLQRELRRRRKLCPADFKKEDCNEQIMQFLSELDGPDGDKLRDLFKKYIKFEEELAAGDRTGVKGKNLVERYELLKKKRREVFGPDDAHLVFGLEEANFAYQQLIHRFLTKADKRPPSERLSDIQAERGQIFGDYNATLKEREGEGGRYGMELVARMPELEAMSPADRDATMRKLREKHFGVEKAAEMEKTLAGKTKEETEQLSKLEQFLAAEARLLKENPNLSGEERRKRVDELRREIYGENY